MMTDSGAYKGWRRLGREVMEQVAADDPAGLRQVREHLDELELRYRIAMSRLAGHNCPEGSCQGHAHYSHGEIARELGVTRQAVSKRIGLVD